MMKLELKTKVEAAKLQKEKDIEQKISERESLIGETEKNIVTETRLTNLALSHRGKVRDIYSVGDELLVISTDRISAFDVVLPNGIPKKGEVLNGLSAFWFEIEGMRDIIRNHLITADASQFPAKLQPDFQLLQGRSLFVEKAIPIPIECVVRGYLAGSSWAEYQKTGSVCGIQLQKGLVESQRLPYPLFTAATKAVSGHDQNIAFNQTVGTLREWLAQQPDIIRMDGVTDADQLTAFLMQKSLALFNFGSDFLGNRGVILADTKFEFGISHGQILLIDEVLTPDSSRLWPLDQYKLGEPQPSFDKQYVRDYLTSIGWNKQPPAPKLPEEVVQRTSEKYLEAYRLITGKPLVQ